MKSTLVGSWIKGQSRWSRLVVAVGALALGASAWAQTAVSTLAGTVGAQGLSNTAPGLFNFSNPSGIVVDSTGNLFVADAANNVIRRISTAGVITTFAGSATGVSGSANGNGNAAGFSSPQGLAIDGANNLYVADTGNHAIRKITPAGDVTTVAGTAGGVTPAGGFVNDTGTVARFSGPLGIAVDRAGTAGAAVNIYVADSQNNAIRQVVASSGVVTTLAGGGPALPGFVNDVGTNARFSGPAGIVVDTATTTATTGTLYVADRFNHAIRRIVIAVGPSATVSTLAGSGVAGYLEGSATGAQFSNPLGVAMSGSNILVSDTLNHVIRLITPGGATSLFAGGPGASGSTDGLTTAARFNLPSGITADATATYIVDTANRTIRKIGAITPPSISGQPASASVSAGNNATFTVTVGSSNPPATFQWQVSSDQGLTFSNLTNGTGGVSGATTNQLTLASVTAAQSGTQYRVLVSNGVTQTTSTAASLTVTQIPAITSANATTFVLNQPGTFTVTTTGVPAPTISTVNRPGFLQLTPTGANTATLSGTPTSVDGAGPFVFTINASNTVGSAPAQTFTLTVATTTPPILSTVQNQTLFAGNTSATFSVTATGAPNVFTYQWQRATDGVNFVNLADTVIEGATYTGTTTPTLVINGIGPNMNTNQFRVVVTSTSGTTNSNAGTLLIPPVITSPSTFTFTNNQGNQFFFTASGNPTPTVTVTPLSTLPNGVILSGTSLIGTPTDTFGGSYPFTVTAANSGGTTVQSFTLVIASPQAPAIVSPAAATFNVGQPSSFTFSTIGAPTPTIQLFGALPAGINFIQPTLSGTPTQAGTFTLQVTATNQSGTAQQTFVLTVIGTPPTITTHPTNQTANFGATVKFNAAATGNPTPTVRWQRQPNGTSGFVNLTDDGTFFGTTTNELTIVNVGAALSLDQFRLVANNGSGGDIPSNPAVLTLNLGTVIATIAGQAGFIGSTDGAGTGARFYGPSGIAVDFGNNIYVADSSNHVIRKVTSGGVVTTLAGLAGISGNTDGAGTTARFNSPRGVAVDGAGNVYVADTFNHTIRLISPNGVVSTIAGLSGSAGGVDGVGNLARFSTPTALAVDAGGTLYVADSGNHAIRRVGFGGTVTTYAGTLGQGGFADSGTATTARFSSPSGLALDSASNLYVADTLNHVIRRISFGGPTGGNTTTIAGAPGNPGSTDGIGNAARFNQPAGVGVEFSGANIYVADTQNSTIRKVTSAGEVTTMAGVAFATGSTDGTGVGARFNMPVGVTVDFAGNIYIADTQNHTIRRTGPATAPQFQTHPTNATAQIGQAVTLTANASGSPSPGYYWQRQAVGTFGFVNLTNDGVYSGVSTSTLTISNATAAMTGDQFRVIANNGFPTVATSNTATLSIGTAPVITSPATATFQAGTAGSFQVTATSTPAATFSSPNLPSWATLNATTGQLTGTPPDTTGSPITITIVASNGIQATQSLVLTITPAVVPPVITAQPINAVVDQGGNATFTVTHSGTPPFTYQWRRNGVALTGATTATLTLAGVQPTNEGTYSVTVTNAASSVTSAGATLIVNTAPTFATQPRTQTALAGGTVTFSVEAFGGSGFTYQWRKNGVPIVGANGPTLTLSGVTATDAANYDVQVSNSIGVVNSSLAQLTVVSVPAAPVITLQPAPRTVIAGSSIILSVAASGAPSPSYQWRRNGATIAGANSPTLLISSAQASDAANYDVVITNSAGGVTTNVAGLRVIARSYAGYYFGTFSGGLGNYALYVREDNTGVFLGYLPGSTAPVMNLNVTVSDSGQFTFGQAAIASADVAIVEGEPARAAALAPVTVSGTIANDGTLSGSIQGGASGTLSGSRAADTGGSQAVAGFYQAGAGANATTAYTIAGPNTQAFVVVTSGATSDGGLGTVNAGGQVSVAGSRTSISETIATSSRTLTGSVTGAFTAALSGGSDAVLARQRLVNISSRARVATGDAVAIAGFVISGQESKPVLIRAVGPTLASFGVAGTLAAPRLELFQGSTSLAVNSGIGTNRANIDAAGAQAGAFALGAAGTDAAILTTLAPGNYTAVLSSANNTAGVALVEVYDLSAMSPGQKLLNIATRASAGTAENMLIAGFVIPPGSSKKVLVRGVGPGLTPFGVTGVLAQPSLALISGAATVAQNSNWVTSADSAAITAASAQVGAFGLATNDSALIVTLAPGNYTAQVTGAGGATGVALIEVYELP